MLKHYSQNAVHYAAPSNEVIITDFAGVLCQSVSVTEPIGDLENLFNE